MEDNNTNRTMMETGTPTNTSSAPDALVSRRKLLASLGMAGLAAAAGSTLLSANHDPLSVISSTYGDEGCCEELAEWIGDLDLFRPQDPDIISKLKNESTERGLNVIWFGAVGDGITDDTVALQAAINAAASSNRMVISPPSLIFRTTDSLHVPSDMTIDLNGSTIGTIRTISYPAVVLGGSNIRIQNAAIIQQDHNYAARVGVEGIAVLPGISVDNIQLRNIQTEGFENGICIWPSDGYMATNIIVENCTTRYAELAGISISNAKVVCVRNHCATYNRKDGMKLSKDAALVYVQGGYFSYNVDPVSTYADGIDMYAGGNACIVHGAVCEYNGGVGIHMFSGEPNDPNYQNPISGVIRHNIISDCLCQYNLAAGYDVVVKLSVSSTTPYTSKVIMNGCISHSNRFGIHVAARNVIVSNCVISHNERHGVQIFDSIFITLNSCHLIKNSASSPGTYAGLFLSGCKHLEVNGGVINGSDSELLQNEDGSALTPYHLYGIWIKDTANCDHLHIRHPIIFHFTGTRGVFVDNYTLPAYAGKLIVVQLGDIGGNPLTDQIGSYGSSLYKDGRKYTKNSNLNQTAWDLELRTTYGQASVTADGTATTFAIAHPLGTAPLNYRVTPANGSACGDHYVTTDASHLYVTYVTAPSSGTLSFQWEASA